MNRHFKLIKSTAFMVVFSLLRYVDSQSNANIFELENGNRIASNVTRVGIKQATSDISCASSCSSHGTCCSASYEIETSTCFLDSCCYPVTEAFLDALVIRTNSKKEMHSTNGNNRFCNLAYHRQTTQSSIYDNSGIYGSPCNAVDGLKSQDFYEGSCVHTQKEFVTWWEVDLGAKYTIKSVNVSVRADHSSHYERFSSVDVTVDALYCGYYTGPPHLSEINEPVTITCSDGITGRYLKLERSVHDTFQFCEVEVFANLTVCPDPPEPWTCRELSHQPCV
ncbi:unnamed protein product [Mytilus coruscus]|uniref:Fucolectin tachylectin-4 pentraxin-1 domain-containing protein n=1 Tax=Mytilus coruscus TaxID=42192 RepID=A0A6J8BUI6_MYTCO|nr:unnamed protein product [Mytilus coruscus]